MTGPDTPIACLGLGAMGSGLAHRLLDAGRPVSVFNRTEAKAGPLAERGARCAATPVAAVEDAATVLVSLSGPEAVAEVLFGEDGAVHGLKPGAVVVDASTVSPDFSRACTARLAEAGVSRVEACLIGNPFQARSGEVRVLAAGEEADVAKVSDLLAAIGKQTWHIGGTGSAASAKLAFNALLGVQLAGLAEALDIGAAGGVDRDRLLEAIAGSGFSSPVLSFRAALVRDDRLVPAAFRTDLMAKDLRLAEATARDGGLDADLVTHAARRFAALTGRGDGAKDAAVVLAGEVPAFLQAQARGRAQPPGVG
ncbi:NAD(P)-dependent oxidoreductase [Amycolatopsis tolypomycina]|uniref:3-hydroxyisobutyrate dehydrogenase n=1 Tax=Amycolatopsis tolypomycina TaxID=208445 RepID=A0A1H4TYI5_9PSEU|nr:NAD(P)-dependent oxidoreductase [Amycolatopsis tolypomycina]SEC61084.1 3-hydroxyisobutyrate dehydrogenase [Amycolatopsis tolypomycina]